MEKHVREERYKGLETGNTEGGEQIQNIFARFGWTNKMLFPNQYLVLLTAKIDLNEMRRQSKSTLRHTDGDKPNWHHW